MLWKLQHVSLELQMPGPTTSIATLQIENGNSSFLRTSTVAACHTSSSSSANCRPLFVAPHSSFLSSAKSHRVDSAPMPPQTHPVVYNPPPRPLRRLIYPPSC
jgi:hypothetical protein